MNSLNQSLLRTYIAQIKDFLEGDLSLKDPHTILKLSDTFTIRVNSDVCDALTEALSNPPFTVDPGFLFKYFHDSVTNTFVVSTRSGIAHASILVGFRQSMTEVYTRVVSEYPSAILREWGAPTCNLVVDGERVREAIQPASAVSFQIKPQSQLQFEPMIPSFVLEVGLSERPVVLRNIVMKWLYSTGGAVLIVFVVRLVRPYLDDIRDPTKWIAYLEAFRRCAQLTLLSL